MNAAEIEGYVTVSPDQWDDVKSSVEIINQMIAGVGAKDNVEDNDPGIMQRLDAYINSLKGEILGAFTIIYGQSGSNGTESWNNASGKERFQLPSQDAGDLGALFMAAGKLNGPGRVTPPRGGDFIQDALPEVTKRSSDIIQIADKYVPRNRKEDSVMIIIDTNQTPHRYRQYMYKKTEVDSAAKRLRRWGRIVK